MIQVLLKNGGFTYFIIFQISHGFTPCLQFLWSTIWEAQCLRQNHLNHTIVSQKALVPEWASQSRWICWRSFCVFFDLDEGKTARPLFLIEYLERRNSNLSTGALFFLCSYIRNYKQVAPFGDSLYSRMMQKLNENESVELSDTTKTGWMLPPRGNHHLPFFHQISWDLKFDPMAPIWIWTWMLWPLWLAARLVSHQEMP